MTVASARATEFQRFYERCPLCNGEDSAGLKRASCETHPSWREPLPRELCWMRCLNCGHDYTEAYWTKAGLAQIFRNSLVHQVAGGHTDESRAMWMRTVEGVAGIVGSPWKAGRIWADIGCGNGGLVMAAAEYGFDAVGYDLRREAVEEIQRLGYEARVGGIENLDGGLSVISMCDVLEHMPFPRQALARAHVLLDYGGVLVLSMPSRDCASWRKTEGGPYWGEIEHHHNFTRESLFALLQSESFEPVRYGVSRRYKSSMEVIAQRKV